MVQAGGGPPPGSPEDFERAQQSLDVALGAAFGGPHGKIVMDWIEQVGYMAHPTYDGDTHAALVHEGMRQMVLLLKARIRLAHSRVQLPTQAQED